MSERKIVWGPDEDTADYVTRVDTDDNDRVIVAETSDGTVLLEWDGDAEQWVYGGPVDMGGEDLDNVGAVNADSVTTDRAAISKIGGIAYATSDQTISSETNAKIEIDEVETDDKFDSSSDFDLDNNKYVVPEDGFYIVSGVVRFKLPDEDDFSAQIRVNGNNEISSSIGQSGPGDTSYPVTYMNRLDKDDEIELWAFNDSSSEEKTKSGSGNTIALMVGRLG